MKPQNIRIAPLNVTPLSTWTVAQVRQALDSHERGRFRTSAQLVDAMGRDPAIGGALGTRVRMLASRSALPFTVHASDSDGRRNEAVARRMLELWWHVCPESTIAPMLRDSIMMGPAVGYNEWQTVDGEWVPRLRWLPAHGLEWHDRSIYSVESEWTYTTGDGQTLPVTPGDGRWVLHLPGGDRAWMYGAVRMLGLPWIMRSMTYRDWVRYCEKHGLPVLGIEEPHWASDDVESDGGSEGTYADEFYDQFRNLGSESVLRLPQGSTAEEGSWKATWIEPQSDSWESFQRLTSDLASQVDRVLLGRDTTAAARGGDGELNTERVRVEYLASDAEPLSTTLRDQVWRPWALYNYGDAELAGWPRWDTRPPPDMQRRADTLKTLGEALTALAPLGLDLSAVVEEFGMSGTVKVPEPPPAPTAPSAPKPGDDAEPEDEDEEPTE